jgi:hypothetical protein
MGRRRACSRAYNGSEEKVIFGQYMPHAVPVNRACVDSDQIGQRQAVALLAHGHPDFS